jgi:hypothetical protein
MSKFSGFDLPGSVQYIDHVWNQIRNSHFQSFLELTGISKHFMFADRVETFERQAGPYLWDGIRLSRRQNRGQLALYYVLVGNFYDTY